MITYQAQRNILPMIFLSEATKMSNCVMINKREGRHLEWIKVKKL